MNNGINDTVEGYYCISVKSDRKNLDRVFATKREMCSRLRKTPKKSANQCGILLTYEEMRYIITV